MAVRWQPRVPQNAQFVPKMMPNGQGTPTVDVQGSGDPVSALQLSASAQHDQPRVSSNGPRKLEPTPNGRLHQN